MNNLIELIGYIATAGTLLSFTQTNILKLRLINGSASIIWVTYGFLIDSNPIIITNLMIILIHSFSYIYNSSNKK